MLLDVKTGKAGLNSIQKKIEDAAAEKRISFDVLRVNEPTQPIAESEETSPQQLKLSVILVEEVPSQNVE